MRYLLKSGTFLILFRSHSQSLRATFKCAFMDAAKTSRIFFQLHSLSNTFHFPSFSAPYKCGLPYSSNVSLFLSVIPFPVPFFLLPFVPHTSVYSLKARFCPIFSIIIYFLILFCPPSSLYATQKCELPYIVAFIPRFPIFLSYSRDLTCLCQLFCFPSAIFVFLA